MTEQELISMVIDEITEHKLSHYRMKNKEYKEINTELTQLGSKVAVGVIRIVSWESRYNKFIYCKACGFSG